jgi:hypothetical protein
MTRIESSRADYGLGTYRANELQGIQIYELKLELLEVEPTIWRRHPFAKKSSHYVVFTDA